MYWKCIIEHFQTGDAGPLICINASRDEATKTIFKYLLKELYLKTLNISINNKIEKNTI